MPGESFINTVQKNNVTVAILPSIVLGMTDFSSSTSLKTIVVGGDVCSEKINQQWNRDGILLINSYGPTEATVCSTIKVCEKNVKPTIGKPIDNTVAYVLDRYLQPVPVGVIGELYIGGIGVARGYLNKPELTRQKFIPNPFIKNTNDPQILYKTGDLVRWLPEGELEYRGRADSQVKIRGYRIELGAIEAILQTYPLVQQAAVMALTNAEEHRYLVGYIVVPFAAEQNFDLNALRKYLADRMPAYMIPQSFVRLDQLPININGKVDKKLLPLPKKRLLLTDATYVAPKTKVEIELAEVWSRILNVENIGINDNFFNLGGHSLLVTEALLYIKQAFNINLSFKSFFNQPLVNLPSSLIIKTITLLTIRLHWLF